MAAALQLAGFRHVIATMWAISDRTAPIGADEAYAALAADQETMGDGDLPAAYSLHAAITKLRAMRSPLVNWTAYIHTGP